ncbi:MAG: peptide ABC transporter substrate-binding protein [Candidatus Promineifilaceae bacterium]
MKPNIRWQLLLAAGCLGLILAFLSFRGHKVVIQADGGTVQTADASGVCTARIPAAGWTLVEGIIGRPQYINPLLAEANPVDQTLSDLVFDGLTRYDENGRLVPDLAQSWSFSEDGRHVSFSLRTDVKWHDGEPFTAEDVAYTYGLLQNENFPAADERVRTLWESVAITVTGELSVEFKLPQPYSPFLDATTQGILPAHLLDGTNPSRLLDASFNRMPIGTGPFLVERGSDWQESGVLRLQSNPDYWQQSLYLDTLEFRFFPDGQALAEAFESGEIQAISTIPAEDLPALITTPGLGIYSSEGDEYTQLLFNQTDTGLDALRDVRVRKALAYALDKGALIDGAVDSQGLPLDGPYLPSSWAYNEGLLTRYTYQPETAASLFADAGWTIPEGGTTRQQGDAMLSLRLLTSDDVIHRDLADLLASQWAAVGVETEIETVQPVSLTAVLAERAFDVAVIDVTPPGDPDLYDFWSQEAIIRGQNYGGWNNQRASEALEAARKLTTQDERQPYYEAFLKFYDTDLPALTLYQPVVTFGLAENVEGADVGRFTSPRERYKTLANWFVEYEEVAVPCPES